MKPEEHVLESAYGKFTRKVWLVRGAQGEQSKLCVFLDAEYYLDRMDALSILDDLQAQNRIPALTYAFVSNQDHAARHEDYACNRRYARYIAEDLFRWAAGQCPGISPEDNLICGLSLSGLASAHIALTHPHRFSRGLCQSGSFWWNDEWLARNVDARRRTAGRFWLSVGDQETQCGITHPPSGMRQDVSQIAAVQNLAGALEANGATVHLNLFAGSHAIEP